MGIRFRCKNCYQKYELATEWAGKVSECLRCGIAMQVPDEDSQKSNELRNAITVNDLNHPDNIQQIQVVSATARTGTPDDIIFRCKLCRQKYRLSKDLAGQVATCAKCKKNMVVPSASDGSVKPENSIIFWCKICGAKYRLNNKLIGQQVECTRCKSTFPVPEVSETAPPPRQSGQKSACTISPDIIKNGMVTAETTDSPANIKTIRAVKAVYKISDPLDRIPVRSKPYQMVDKAPAAPPATITDLPAPKEEEAKKSDSVKLHHFEPDSEKTHSTIVATKTVTMMVKYVIKLPRENILWTWLSVIFDWITQLAIFRWIPRKVFVYIIILLALAGSLYFARNLFPKKDRPPQFQIHTMCQKCGKREILTLLDIEEGICSNESCAKCRTKVGYAWKCWKCLKHFPKFNTDKIIIQDPKLSKQEKMLLLKPPKCPYCRSTKVNYVSAEDATFG
ncbi:MAG: hypothetical protein WCV67_01560 [Victivallaceae bacterium]